MLLGTFARNQFSDGLTAEKIPGHDLAISVREVTRVHSLKSVSRSEGVELSGVNVVLRTSVAARLQKQIQK